MNLLTDMKRPKVLGGNQSYFKFFGADSLFSLENLIDLEVNSFESFGVYAIQQELASPSSQLFKALRAALLNNEDHLR